MASVAILVNGIPGSGKSTLAAALGPILDCPVLSKDRIKEGFGDLLPLADSRRLGGLAMDTLWRLAAETEGGIVIDANLDARTDGLDFARRGLEVAGSPRLVELWCEVPSALARQRFLAREPSRHAVHHGWDAETEGAEPLGAHPGGSSLVGQWPVVRVDTSAPVDLDALVVELGAHFL